MKKILSMIIIVAIFISSLSFAAVAQENDILYSFELSEGEKFYYYKNSDGDPYIIEDGKKYNIAVPEYVEQVTDQSQLMMLRNEGNKIRLNSATDSDILFSQTVYFNSLVKTNVLNVSKDYLYLKCSNLNPSNAKRGFSYWILYSVDNVTWMRAFYANQSLTFYTRHPMAMLGNAPYIIIHIFSYYGTVSSCLFSVKQGGVLG